MTDYLEMLFVPRGEFEQGGEDIPALRAPREEHEPEQLPKAVMAREDLKYCPHGRPICVTLSKKQLEKQFKRT